MGIEIINSEFSVIKVFLGGTCNDDTWRDEFVKGLKMPYFNPVVSELNEEAQQREEREKLESAYCIFTITDKMNGVYSIAELIDSVHRNSYGTIFINLTKSLDEDRMKSLKAIEALVEKRGSNVFHSLDEARDFLNTEWDILRM